VNFLALVITLLLRQFWGSGTRVQQDDWFRRWQGQVSGWNLGPVGQLVATIMPALAVAHLMLNALEPVLFGLVWIALAVVLLLYAMGRGDFQQQMARYRHQCIAGDFEGAYLGTLPELGSTNGADNPQSLEAVHALVQRGFFYEGYQRWFPVLFYFALLGPVAALAYRLLQLYQHNDESLLCGRLIFCLDWLPARLLAATFTLVGDFVGSRDTLFHALGDSAAEPGQFLYAVGSKALGDTSLADSNGRSPGEVAADQNEDVEKLLSRSAVCWVALISLIVVLG
jgi:AmpE protein